MSDKKNRPKKFRKRGQDSSSSSSSSESTSSLSSDDESNSRDLKPIKDYLGDRKELARQLFIAVKGDKLRMMLPQDLKKMELTELEEWCANELSGMSKTRILSILNGQPMLQSSDSNDTDDSGPSLEIISDTEEWGDVSDSEAISKEEELFSKKTAGSRRDKTRSKVRAEKGNREKEKDKARSKFSKGKIKSETDSKSSQKSSADLTKVKKETEPTEQVKEKDGESLLDLLELEMRARAIRALIRKEEDIIPNNPSGSGPAPQAIMNESTTSKTKAKDRQLSLKVVQDKLDELDNSFNRNVSQSKAQDLSEEEDVVLVLQPTTTIELISSESETEGGQSKRRCQKFENERSGLKITVTDEARSSEIQGDSKKDKLEDPKNPEIEKNKPLHTNLETSSTLTKVLPSEKEKVVENSSKKVTTDLEAFRKLKRRPPIRVTENREKVEKISEPESDGAIILIVNNKDGESLSDVPKPAEPEEDNNQLEEEVKVEPEQKIESNMEKHDADEDKSTDLEIVIDLDDYPDDMENLAAGEEARKKTAASLNLEVMSEKVSSKPESVKPGNETVGQNAAETWATRYYQTEDVQSVIKESKIQSEIRKRLRERQRLARLNNSPNLNNSSQPISSAVSAANSTAEKFPDCKEDSPTTTGSVEEYLALKTVETVSPSEDLAVEGSVAVKVDLDTKINSETFASSLTDEKLVDKT